MVSVLKFNAYGLESLLCDEAAKETDLMVVPSWF